MNDWWNDPPEQPDPPECCGEITSPMRDGGARCVECGKRFAPDTGQFLEDGGTYAVPERFEAQSADSGFAPSWLVLLVITTTLVATWTASGFWVRLHATVVLALLACDRLLLFHAMRELAKGTRS